jgi:short-subunit dehydrogenase
MVTFDGKAVLISGASAGIGRALALQLAQSRAHLALNGRDRTTLRETADGCRALGAEVLELPADVSNEASCQVLVASTVERFGRLDALVNNAGVTMWSRFDQVSDLAAFERVMAVNYLGAVYLTAAALEHLKRSHGMIVAVASVAGLTGVPERTGYAASKHAMVGFFESLRIELKASGVSVTVIAPDFVESDLHRRAIGPDGQPLGKRPLEGRHMTSEECARRIVRAMQRRQRLVITSLRGHLGLWARLVIPDVVDRIAERAIRTRR